MMHIVDEALAYSVAYLVYKYAMINECGIYLA